MTMPAHAVVTDALDCLTAMTHDRVRPQEARVMLRAVAARHPGTRLDLVWEEEAYDGSLHYDALIRRPGGTVSLSWCAEHALPWPLRGVQRWRDADLVRVNDTVLQVAHAIRLLDALWDDKRRLGRLIDACLIDEELAREPVTLSGAELQRAMDGFRRSRGLYTQEATRRWMARQELTQAGFEELVARQARVAAVRERVTAGQIESWLAAHRDEFDTARIARFDVADAEEARRVCAAIRGGAIDFLAAAQGAFLAMPADADALALFRTIRRGDAEPALRDTVFAATPGVILDPVPVEDGYAIVQLLAVARAELDAATCRLVQQRLFERWLAEQRRNARIEWNWGRDEQTRAA